VAVLFEVVRDALRERRPAALATVIDGPNLGAKLLLEPGRPPQGSLGDPDLDRVVARDMAGELAAGRTGVRHYGPQGQANDERLKVFIESYASPPEMLIFGAVDFTAALCAAAKGLGYRVTVCDAREVFATRSRFPLADDVVVDWPNRLLGRVGGQLGPADAVCVLTHDPKFDVPAIMAALETDVGYLGVMGSRATHARRMKRLAEEGITDPRDLGRIMAPIGLDIGARTPEETAIAVCAEIISLRTGRAGGSLRDTAGPIHG